MLLDVILYFLCCKVIVRLQCADILSRNAGYFVVAHFVVVAQVKGDALLSG